ncbi:hypothetical protein [Anabaena lutea]|uniref:Uncharacterized protein n=1 Tax=Anabaena lutea FACHB-196 TaxID=2692881 RepID=A0ABR8FIH6_9NOST|nr:hypothetical protein [Anabaena lutea]MBD2569956.1 hypothetical protein [Anabaena lutea FACHB-196]
MSQILTLELSDKIAIAIQQQANNVGISPESLATALLEQHFSQVLPVSTDVQKELAQAKFEHHFGTLNIYSSTNIDNESIDADLAREYANNHEDD